MLLADLPLLVAAILVLDLVPASAAFVAAQSGRGLLLVLLLRRRPYQQLLLLLLLDLLLLLLPLLLLDRSMQRMPHLVLLELVQHQWNGWDWRIRRMQRIRQLERVVVLLGDVNATPLLQLVLVLAPMMAVPLAQPVGFLQVLLQRRQLLQVLLQHRQLLLLFELLFHAPLLLVLRSSCSTQSPNLPSRFLGASISLSWKLVPLMCHQPPELDNE